MINLYILGGDRGLIIRCFTVAYNAGGLGEKKNKRGKVMVGEAIKQHEAYNHCIHVLCMYLCACFRVRVCVYKKIYNWYQGKEKGGRGGK
jgi:hypothetical protein